MFEDKVLKHKRAEGYYRRNAALGNVDGAWKNFVESNKVQDPSSMDPEPRNMYAEGQLVRNTVDGSRPGYGGLDAAKRKLAFNALEKVIDDDKLIEIKKLAREIKVPATTVKRVFDENFINKGILKESKGASEVIDKIIESGVTDLDEINQIAKDTYKVNLSDRAIQAKINKTTDLSIAEYEQIFRKMAADRTYEPPIDISAKGKGLTANYIKAKENLKIEIPQLQKLIQQNSDKRSRAKLKKKIEADPVLKIKNLVDKQIIRDKKRFKEKGKIGLSTREVDLNTQQRLLIKEANELINSNPTALLKDKNLLEKISWRVDGEGNLYQSKPDLTKVLDSKSNSRFFHVSHGRRAQLGTELTDAPVNRFVAPFSTNNEFIKDAETFIEKNPDHPKVKDILKKAEKLKITLRPDVPLGTFKNTKGNPVRYVGYTENINDPVGKIKTVIDEYMPKELKPKNVGKDIEAKIKELGGKEKLNKLLFEGGGTKVERGLIQRIVSGGGKMAISMLNPRELIKLKNLVGPGALGLMAAYEAGSITDDVLRLNKPLDEALAGNWVTKSFLPYSEEFAKQKNLLQSGNLTGSQKEYAEEMMKIEKAIKEDKRISMMESTQVVDEAFDDNFTINSQEKIDAAKRKLTGQENRIKESSFVEGSGRQLENKALMDDYEDAQKARTGASTIFGGPQSLVNKAPRPKNMGRGPMTEKKRMKLDFSIPGITPYNKTYTPSDKEISDYFQTLKDPQTLNPGEGTEISMGMGGEGLYGTQNKFATGGIADLMKKKYD